MKTGTWILCLAALLFTPLLSSASTQREETSIDITVFIRGSFAISRGDDCRPNIEGESSPKLRMISADGSSIEIINLKWSEPVGSDNEYVAGEPGCVMSRTNTFKMDESYVFELGGRELFTADWDYLESHSEMLIVVDATSVTAPDMQDLEVPAGSATPEPTLAASTPVPAGDQGNGKFLIRGYMTLLDDDAVVAGDLCFGSGGYDDVGSGTQVVVRDGENNVLGVGYLVYVVGQDRGQGCEFVFEVEVEETGFYQIEMSHRGQMVFTFDDLEEADWIVRLSIG